MAAGDRAKLPRGQVLLLPIRGRWVPRWSSSLNWPVVFHVSVHTTGTFSCMISMVPPPLLACISPQPRDPHHPSCTPTVATNLSNGFLPMVSHVTEYRVVHTHEAGEVGAGKSNYTGWEWFILSRGSDSPDTVGSDAHYQCVDILPTRVRISHWVPRLYRSAIRQGGWWLPAHGPHAR